MATEKKDFHETEEIDEIVKRDVKTITSLIKREETQTLS